jgi:hypothetical protein
MCLAPLPVRTPGWGERRSAAIMMAGATATGALAGEEPCAH